MASLMRFRRDAGEDFVPHVGLHLGKDAEAADEPGRQPLVAREGNGECDQAEGADRDVRLSPAEGFLHCAAAVLPAERFPAGGAGQPRTHGAVSQPPHLAAVGIHEHEGKPRGGSVLGAQPHHAAGVDSLVQRHSTILQKKSRSIQYPGGAAGVKSGASRRNDNGHCAGTLGGDPEGQCAQGQGAHDRAAGRGRPARATCSTRAFWTEWKRSAGASRQTRSTSRRC